MEVTNICPHCKQALTEEGQRLAHAREAEKAKAEALYKNVADMYWILRHQERIVPTWVSCLAFTSLFSLILTKGLQDSTIVFSALALIFAAIFPLTALVCLKRKKAWKEFKSKYPMESQLLN